MISQSYLDIFDQTQVEHLLKNHSITTLGYRHPSMPVGWVIRDQGILDLFAGATKFCIDLEGFALLKAAKFISINGGIVRLRADSFDKIIIQNRKFNAKAYNKTKVAYLKKADGLSVMNASTKADPHTGIISPKIPLTDVFDFDDIFDDVTELPTYTTESVGLWRVF